MELPRINLSQLITLYLVATEESFTSAAKRLFLTESAVSQQIRSLEKSTGSRLINIKKKKVHLTETGHVLFDYAGEIYNIANKAQNFIEQTRHQGLRVGFAKSLSSIVVSAAIQFQNLYPDIKLTVRGDSSKNITSQMLELQHDVAIVIKTDYEADKFRTVKISEEKFVLVTGWTTPLGRSEPLNLADIIDQTFIIPRASAGANELLFRRFKAEGLEPKNTMVIQMDYIQCSKMLVGMGKGVAIMPEIEARKEVEERRLRILRLVDDIKADVEALFLKGVPEYKPAEKFVSLVGKAFEASHAGDIVSNHVGSVVSQN